MIVTNPLKQHGVRRVKVSIFHPCKTEGFADRLKRDGVVHNRLVRKTCKRRIRLTFVNEVAMNFISEHGDAML